MALNSGDHPLHFVSDEKSAVIAQGWLCARIEVDIRMLLKIKKKVFLRPGDKTPTAFKLGVSIDRYISISILIKYSNFSRFYKKKLGPFYKKLRCDKFVN